MGDDEAGAQYVPTKHTNIHLLDDVESNIIFILSRRKYWSRAQPETNIFSRDKINIMLDEVVSK